MRLVRGRKCPRADAGKAYAWGENRVGETDCPAAAGLVDTYVDRFDAVIYDRLMAAKLGEPIGVVTIT